MGGAAVASSTRVRIKGRKLSVIRFLIVSVAYTTPWIVMLSQLAYYSKIYGPQVLLQLNIAYYLPSIPILLLLGHIEKVLDEQFGSTASMAIRLTIGLTGCAAISAVYPFIPGRLSFLLWLVVGLGSISAVAFSTSYQLVAWFRSADTIALGIGCVASGPLALVIQVALQIGTTPKRWQWIALFEAAAALVLVGLVAAWSLLWQYWDILCGSEQYVDSSAPLLDTVEQAQADHAQADHVDKEAGEQALLLSRMLTMQDPFQGFPYTTVPGMELPQLRPLLRRALSDDPSDVRRLPHRTAAAAAAAARALQRQNTTPGSSPRARAAAAAAAAATAAAAAGLPRRSGTAAAAAAASKLSGGAGGAASQPASLTSGRQRTQQWLQQQHGGGGGWQQQPAAGSSAGSAWFGDIEQQQQQQQQQQCGSGGPPHAPPAAGSCGGSSLHSGGSRPASPCKVPTHRTGDVSSRTPNAPAAGVATARGPMAASAPTTTTGSLLGDDEDDTEGVALTNALVAAATAAAAAAAAAAPGDEPERPAADWPSNAEQQQQLQQAGAPHFGRGGGSSSSSRRGALPAVAAGSQLAAGSEGAAAAAGSSCCGVAASDAASARGEATDPSSLGGVYWEVFGYCWSTVLAALVSSTLLNCIFPFFTYVESSGMLGEFLPQVLFYTRMLSDILGRLLPRRKALAITSPAALLALSCALLLCSVAFFVYLQAPPHMQYDPYVLVLVLALWLGGGYIKLWLGGAYIE
ncbi:hypothetical protein COO60DRAFT_1700650 [Scenedesmus sp. NREL 46B-D3]|nr:hypothetical protein COO60DRAFT_1700650 [Scenedesmus sp. NREL 46B-D3]